MARIRTIKPDFFRHEDLYELEVKTSLPIRVAFAGLFTVADREGRFKWKPSLIKLDVLPFDEINMTDVLNALWIDGFIGKYEVDGKEFGFIPSFTSHQIINNRESVSSLPEPKNLIQPRVNHASTTRHDPAQGEGKGREGNGREGNVLTEASASDIPLKKNDSAIEISDCDPNLIYTTSGEVDSKTVEEEESLEKNKKNCDQENYPFEHFWNLYDKKVGKAESIRCWSKLKDADKELIMDYVERYKIAQPDPQFRKHPHKFLTKKCWLDEIIPSKNLIAPFRTPQANQSKLNTLLEIAADI